LELSNHKGKKLLALDIDGTLADGNFQISEENIKWLKRAKDHAYILLTSTRPYPAVAQVAEKIGLEDGYLIAMAGCDIRRYPVGEVISQKAVERSQVEALLQFAKDRQSYVQVFTMDGTYYFLEETEYSHLYEKFIRYPGKNMAQFSWDDAVGKVIFIEEEENMAQLTADLREMLPSQLRADQVWQQVLEVFDASVTKGSAVQYVAKQLQVPQKDIISMGDEEVDISMFEVSGLGVAVANAKPEVKAKADLVTVSNEEHAVAKIIKQYILKIEE
jgi:Cof subfamily protein (haloacid dehalogenase superfamily)